MSSCLIFHRPDICSTTSLESISTCTRASGSRSRAIRSPATSPEYSATLLDAFPSGAASVRRISPVAGSRTRAP